MKHSVFFAAMFSASAALFSAEPLFEVNGKILTAEVKGETLTLRSFLPRFRQTAEAPAAPGLKAGGTFTLQIADHRALTPSQKEALAKVKYPYGFILRFDGSTFEILAKNAQGTSYAYNQFLREFCGFRIFGGMGSYAIGKMPYKLPVPFEKIYEPSLPSLTVAWGGDAGFDRNVRTLIFSTHSMFKVVPPEKYGATNPEYFPMINGKRYIPPEKERYGLWQPCLSNGKLVDLAMEYAEEYFKKNPDNLSLPLGVNDGGGSCHCPGCEELKRKYGNQYIPFYNAVAKRVAEKYPGKLVSFIAYGEAAPVPHDITLEPNILVEIANGLGGRMEAWRKAGAKHFGTYEYYNTIGAGYVIPMYYPHTVGNQWKEAYREYGIQSVWLELYPVTWVFASPRMYVLNTLAWNINADIDVLLDEYFTAVYGKAALFVRKVFDIFEKRCQRKYYNDIRQIDGYTLEDVAEMDSLLEQAAAAETGERQAREIRRLRNLYSFCRHYFLLAGVLRKMDEAETAAQFLTYAETALESCEALSKYTMAKEESMELCVNSSGQPADRFPQIKNQSRLQPAFHTEQRINAKAEEISKKQPAGTDLPAFWSKELKNVKNQNLKSIIRSPSYCQLSPDSKKNLIGNHSFETTTELKGPQTGAGPGGDQMPFIAKGWRTWAFPNSKAQIGLDTTEAQDGKQCAFIGENQIGAAVIRDFHVRPDCRYKLSFCVKASGRKTLSGGGAEIRFTGNGGWLDDGSAVRAGFPEDCIGAWKKVEITFQPVKDAVNGMLILSAPIQKEGEKIFFDNVSVTKIYDPAFFGENAMIDAFAWSESEGVYLHPFETGDPEILHALDFVRTTLKNAGFLASAAEKSNIEIAVRTAPVEKTGSFKLSLDKKTVTVSGDAEGIRCGLYDLLEIMGFRWFSPQEKISAPWMIRVDTARLNAVRVPAFPFRGLHICGGKMHHDPDVAQWMSFHKMNRRLCSFGEVRKQHQILAELGLKADTTVHTYYELIPDKEYFESHPEFFALVGGKRIKQSAGGQLCLSNPEMRKEFVKNIIKAADELPQATEIGICPNDGYGHCECDACKALDTEEDKASGHGINGRIADFAAEISREVLRQRPGIRLGHFSYSNFGRFTEYLKEPLPNVKLSVTTFRCLRHAINDPECKVNAPSWKRILAAKEKSDHVSIYEYYTYLWSHMPAPFTPVIEKDFRAFQSLGLDGLLSECSAAHYPEWKSYHYLFCYAAKALYDGPVDSDEFLRDYCRHRFPGGAADAMFRYFKQLEKQLLAGNECFNRKPDDLPRLLTPETVKICREALKEASERIYKPKAAALKQEKEQFEYWVKLITERPKYAAPKKVRPLPWSGFEAGAAPADSVADSSEDLMDSMLDPATSVKKDENRLVFVDKTSLLPPEKAAASASVYESADEIGFIVECEEPNMAALRKAMDSITKTTLGALCANDGIEIFIAKQKDPSVLWHFLVSADGKHIAASECRGQNWNWSWRDKLKLRSESRMESGKWILKFAFRKADLPIGPDEAWSFSLVRNRFKPVWTISGIPEGGAFFKPEKYIPAEKKGSRK